MDPVANRKRPSGAFLVNVGVTVAAFGLAPFLKKSVLENGASPWMVALVSALAAATISIVIASRRVPNLVGGLLDPRHLRALVLIGIVATGIVTLLVSLALTTTTATNRSLFQAAYPASTLLFAHLLLGERLRWLQYACIVAITLGLFLVNAGHDGVRFGQGFWLLLATLPLIGLSDVYGKRLTADIPPVLIACGRNVYGALFVVGVVIFLELGPRPEVLDIALLSAAGICQGLGIWTLYRAFELDKASLVSSLVATAPLVTAVLELLLLTLALDPVQWTGVALVIAAAVLLAQTASNGRAD
jgi:drug/metabolite transporter (DMT)-like permease